MATTRTPLMAGNWKSNLNHQEAVVLVQKLAWTLNGQEARLRPRRGRRGAAVHRHPLVQTLVDGDRLQIRYGAQDVSEHDGGAYTGEISAAMLTKLAARTSWSATASGAIPRASPTPLVNTKAHKALEAGMTPIVCVGEGLEVRQAGEHVPHTMAQVEGSLAGFTPSRWPTW